MYTRDEIRKAALKAVVPPNADPTGYIVTRVARAAAHHGSDWYWISYKKADPLATFAEAFGGKTRIFRGRFWLLPELEEIKKENVNGNA